MTVNPGADSALTLQTARAWTADCFKLTKPKLLSLVLFTTLVGFYTANRGPIPKLLLLHTLIGTALIAGLIVLAGLRQSQSSVSPLVIVEHTPSPTASFGRGIDINLFHKEEVGVISSQKFKQFAREEQTPGGLACVE